MIILSLDSGLEKTGFCVFQQQKKNFLYKESGLIRTSKSDLLEERIRLIFNGLNDVINRFKPKRIIIEKLFFFQNQKTAISVAQTQGIALLLAAQNKIKITFLTPLQIKQAVTGYGKADKQAIRKMIGLTVKIKKKIAEDDEIDAIACGMAFCYLNK